MPTKKILLITTKYLKDNSTINLNVDDELLRPNIIKAQNLRIESILGSDLFNEILDAVTNGTVSGDTETLLVDYIQPTIVEWAIYEALPSLNYKLTNKSVAKKDSDNSTPVELNELSFVREGFRSSAEYYSNRITKFIEANISKYPKYYTNSTVDDIKPSKNNYFSGFYLGDNRNGLCNDGTDHLI